MTWLHLRSHDCSSIHSPVWICSSKVRVLPNSGENDRDSLRLERFIGLEVRLRVQRTSATAFSSLFMAVVAGFSANVGRNEGTGNKNEADWKEAIVGNVVTQDTRHNSGVRASSDKTGKVLNKGANQFESHRINSAKRNTNRNTIKDDNRKNDRSTAKHAVKSQNGGSDEEIENLSLFQIRICFNSSVYLFFCLSSVCIFIIQWSDRCESQSST